MNNNEREQWVRNDEMLYTWWKAEHGLLRDFIKNHRDEIDPYIEHMNHRFDGAGGSNCFVGCPYKR